MTGVCRNFGWLTALELTPGVRRAGHTWYFKNPPTVQKLKQKRLLRQHTRGHFAIECIAVKANDVI